MANKEYKSFTTEKGTAMWVKVNTQVDLYEQPNGDIKETGFVIPVYFDDAYTEKLKKEAAKLIDEAKGSKEYANKKTGKPFVWRERPRMPFKVDSDGKTFFNFKTNHKKKQSDGTFVDKFVPLFDAHGKQMDKMTTIGNGSIVKVNYTPTVFYISDEQNGVKFFLNAIQVIDLVEYNAGSSSDFGFGVEEGYEAPKDEPMDNEEIPF